eukprot:6170025-Prymnesium_polylepis.1
MAQCLMDHGRAAAGVEVADTLDHVEKKGMEARAAGEWARATGVVEPMRQQLQKKFLPKGLAPMAGAMDIDELRAARMPAACSAVCTPGRDARPEHAPAGLRRGQVGPVVDGVAPNGNVRPRAGGEGQHRDRRRLAPAVASHCELGGSSALLAHSSRSFPVVLYNRCKGDSVGGAGACFLCGLQATGEVHKCEVSGRLAALGPRTGDEL